jgi:hypothetical protein
MATKYDRIIDSLFTDPASRAIATDFVTRYADEPMMDGRLEALLREGVLANQRVVSGEITPEAGREYLSSFASEALGTPAHLVASGEAWLNEMATAGGEQTEDAAPRGAEPPGPHSDLIRRLFASPDRAAAAALAKTLAADPQSASRTEAMLTEISRTTDMTPQAAYDYIASFARNIGIPSHLVTSALDAISMPDAAAHEREVTESMAPEVRQMIAANERAEAKQAVSRYERMMRENPAEYWRPENQNAYRQALERSLVGAPVMPMGEPATAPPATAPAKSHAPVVPASQASDAAPAVASA